MSSICSQLEMPSVVSVHIQSIRALSSSRNGTARKLWIAQRQQQLHRQTERHRHRQTDRQTDIQAGRWPGSLRCKPRRHLCHAVAIDRLSVPQTDTYSCRQSRIQTYCTIIRVTCSLQLTSQQTDRQAGRRPGSLHCKLSYTCPMDRC